MNYRILGNPIVGKDLKYRYLYLVHNNKNNKYYYGIHTTTDLDDGYKGSGKRLKNALKKYGDKDFIKYILFFFENEKDMMDKEAEIVNEDLLKDPLCYNIITGGNSCGTVGKCCVIDQNGDIIFVDNNDPKIGVEYKQINSGKVIVKDSNGNNFRVDKNDIRITSGEFVSINKGYIITKDNDGNIYRVHEDDDRIKSGKLAGIAKGYACMKDMDGNIYKVKTDDPRIKSGELISIVKDTVSVVDKDNNKFRVSKNDPRIKTGELSYHTKNRISVIDQFGNTLSVFKNDPRIKSGELISVNKNRIYVNKDSKNKMIYPYELEKYMNDGWVRGIFKKGDIIINKDGKRKMIYFHELEKYMDDGWKRGQGETKQKTGRPKKKINNDHSVYPDTTKESFEAAEHLFKISNWDSELVDYEAPFVEYSKAGVLRMGMDAMEYMEFDEEDIDYILKHTHSCYCPDEHGRSCGLCGTCRERIEAFETNCMVDPIEYAK